MKKNKKTSLVQNSEGTKTPLIWLSVDWYSDNTSGIDFRFLKKVIVA